MEDKIIKEYSEALVEGAKTQAAELIKEAEANNGQLALPQPLAGVQLDTADGEELVLGIVLNQSRDAMARRMGATLLLFMVGHGDKYVTDMIHAGHVFSRFDRVVAMDEFRKEVEQSVADVIKDDGSSVRKRIEKEGISTTDPLMIPSKIQQQVIRVTDNCTLSVGGHVFEGIEGLKGYLREQTDKSRPYLLIRHERFPCFDAYDYANEHRFYINILICKDKQEADKKTKRFEALTAGSNFCLVNNDLPDDMRPMAYYMDESMTMDIAY